MVRGLRLLGDAAGGGDSRGGDNAAQPVPALRPGEVEGDRQEEAGEAEGGELLLLHREQPGAALQHRHQRVRGGGVRPRAAQQDERGVGRGGAGLRGGLLYLWWFFSWSSARPIILRRTTFFR